MTTVVREAVAADLAVIEELMLQYIDFYRRTPPSADKLGGLIRKLLDQRDGIQFVAFQDNEPAGFATLYFSYSSLSAERVTIMNDLFVREPFRGLQVGQALFDKCLAYTREHGFKYMTWVTAGDNHRAQRFYDKMGGQSGDWITYAIE